MPLIFNQEQAEEWLAKETTPDQAFKMIKPFTEEKMKVPDLVGSPTLF